MTVLSFSCYKVYLFTDTCNIIHRSFGSFFANTKFAGFFYRTKRHCSWYLIIIISFAIMLQNNTTTSQLLYWNSLIIDHSESNWLSIFITAVLGHAWPPQFTTSFSIWVSNCQSININSLRAQKKISPRTEKKFLDTLFKWKGMSNNPAKYTLFHDSSFRYHGNGGWSVKK